MADNTQNAPLINPDILNRVHHTQPAVQPKKAKPDVGGFIWGTGRRKTSVARVRIKPGQGAIKINRIEMNEYFVKVQDRETVMAPLKATNTTGSLDVFASVSGGGITGQSGAVMLGIARALKNYDPSILPILHDGGYLTRDGRMKERKKYGQKGARRRFQFSKR